MSRAGSDLTCSKLRYCSNSRLRYCSNPGRGFPLAPNGSQRYISQVAQLIALCLASVRGLHYLVSGAGLPSSAYPQKT
jgi:hypothetical protein